MAIFPKKITDDFDDVIGYSHEITTDMLVEAYSKGIFPWPQSESPILWFCPEERGILEFSEFHIPKKFQKFLKTCHWELRQNTCFEKVILACAEQPRPGQAGTWLTESMIEAYLEFFEQGFVRSFEVFDQDELIGGLYGVQVNGRFSGESMFHFVSEASKWALYSAVQVLMKENQTWIDTQMVTPVVASFGGKTISRGDFLKKLSEKL